MVLVCARHVLARRSLLRQLACTRAVMMTGGPKAVTSILLFVGAASLTADGQRFTSKTIGVRVDVLVTDGNQLVRGLNARDFELRDEGVVQSVSEVEVEELPLNLILAFDTSAS